MVISLHRPLLHALQAQPQWRDVALNPTRNSMRNPISRLVTALSVTPGEYPAAFCTLHAVSVEGLEAGDGVRAVQVPWSTINRITASLGRQAYDMTPVLMIDHARGRSIFLPEVEQLWETFVAAMIIHLPSASRVEDWRDELFQKPDGSVAVYRRPGRLW
jgi:hypothetical protein